MPADIYNSQNQRFKELPEIIQTEVTNCSRIYLYHHKGLVWGCCGRFALLLHRIYSNITYKERDVTGKGDMLPVMIIDPLTLGHLIENYHPIERYEKMMVFEMPEHWKNF